MTAPVRLTAVLTHPIQYYAPWFRHIQEHAPEIALTVVYATQPTPEQQGIGFERAFEWDVPLTGGYQSITVRAAEPGDRIDSSHFTGLDVPAIGGAIAATNPDVVMIPGLAVAHPRPSVVDVPAPRHPHALSWRLTSAERARGLDASALVAQDAAPAAAIRWLSLARASRRRVPREVRRTRLPDLPDAARGRQRAVRDGRIAVSVAAGSRRGAPRLGHRARCLRAAVRRKARRHEASAGSGARSGDARSWRLGAGGRIGAARGGDARRGRPARRRSEGDRVRESNRARSGVRRRRLSRAAERLCGNVGPCRQRSPRDRSAGGGQRCRRLRARSASGRRERIHVSARRRQRACDGARANPPAQGRRIRLGAGVPRHRQRVQLRRDDGRPRPRLPLRDPPFPGARARLERRAAADRRHLRADGHRRRARTDDLRGAACAARSRHGGAQHRERLGEFPDHAAGGGQRRELVGGAILVPAQTADVSRRLPSSGCSSRSCASAATC